jgi:hypothetical protein
VDVDVDSATELLGKSEDRVEMPNGIPIQLAGVDPSDQIGTESERLAHQPDGSALQVQADLWKRDNLHVGTVPVRLTSSQNPFEPL